MIKFKKYAKGGWLMKIMLCNIWDDFSNWVTLQWTQTTYIIVLSVFVLCGLLGALSFFKKSINKDKRPKWGILVVSIICFALAVVLALARFA